MPEGPFVFAIIFLAFFVQTFLGFGSAIVAMALLPGVIGLHQAAALFSLIAILYHPLLVLYYRHGLDLRSIWRLMLGSLAGIPVGILMLERLPEAVTLPILGLIMIGYGLYALSPFKLPEFQKPAWAYLFGLLSGAFGGAYNVTGPPVILYGHARRWTPAQFKANLQAFFLFSSLAIVAGHAINGSYGAEIWPLVRSALPASLAAVAAGVLLDRFVRPEVFEKAVLVGLMVLGLGLVL